MASFFTSPWVIGIIGGIISGVIVYFITNLIITRKEKKLYKQKISPANSEIMQTIRPLIINKERFNKEIYDSIVSSLANKHDVATDDLYSLKELSNDVITDIIQTPFLTSDQKDEYSSTLLSIKTDNEKEDVKEKIIYINKAQRSSISSKYLSVTLAMTSSLFALITTLIMLMDKSEISNLINGDFFKISSTGLLTIVLIPVLSIMSISMTEILKRKKKDISNTREKENQERNNKDTI